jgi:hypothetical protein
MASGFMDGLRRGRDAAIAARGRQRRPSVEAEPDYDTPQMDDSSGEEAYRALEAEHEESKRLIAELAETVELLDRRVIELIKGAEPMANVLRIPGVRTFLLQHCHPDRHPNASAEEREVWTEAMKAINLVYAFLAKELQSMD